LLTNTRVEVFLLASNFKEQGGWDSVTFKTYKNQSGSTTVVNTQVGYTDVNYKSTFGHTIPGFKKRLRDGDLLPHTSFEQYEHTGHCEYHFTWRRSSWPGTGDKQWTDPVGGNAQSIFGPSIESCRLLCNEHGEDHAYYVQAAAAKLATAGWDALTFLSELRKTIAMFMDVGHKLRRLMNGKPPGKPWDLWLEGRYGWRTLLLDLRELDEALHKLDVSREISSERTGSSQIWNSNAVSSSSSVVWTQTIEDNNLYSLSTRGAVSARIKLARFQFNPLLTAWETVKFSFVVDWILSVGSSLAALSFLALQKEYTASFGYKLSVEREFRVTAVAKSGFIVDDYTNLTTAQVNYTTRIPTTVSFIPRFKLKIDGAKIIDLMSLISQALLRR